MEKATIDECLAHVGDFAITDIYAERSWELMAAANRKVLDLFSARFCVILTMFCAQQ